MALYFDILKLEKLTDYNPEYMIIALEHWYNKRTIPKSKYEKYKPLKEAINGYSFLLNPEAFFNDKTTDIFYKSQYLQLAGRRDWYLYKQFRIKYLNLNDYPEIETSIIYLNPLFTIKHNKLHFKYEEN